MFRAGVGDAGAVQLLAQQAVVGVALAVDYGGAVKGRVGCGDLADDGAHFLVRVGGGDDGEAVGIGQGDGGIGGGRIVPGEGGDDLAPPLCQQRLL